MDHVGEDATFVPSRHDKARAWRQYLDLRDEGRQQLEEASLVSHFRGTLGHLYSLLEGLVYAADGGPEMVRTTALEKHAELHLHESQGLHVRLERQLGCRWKLSHTFKAAPEDDILEDVPLPEWLLAAAVGRCVGESAVQ